MHSLTKGTPYYVRIYAYNSFGYSVTAGMGPDKFESPKRQADPPSVVNVAAASATSLMITFPASADNGGGEVTKYKVEWDSVGQAGAAAGVAQYNESMLYGYSVQTVETSAARRHLRDIRLNSTITLPRTWRYLRARPRRKPRPVAIGDVTVSRSEKSSSRWIMATFGL